MFLELNELKKKGQNLFTLRKPAFRHIKEKLYGQSLSLKTFTVFAGDHHLSFLLYSWVSTSL